MDLDFRQFAVSGMLYTVVLLERGKRFAKEPPRNWLDMKQNRRLRGCPGCRCGPWACHKVPCSLSPMLADGTVAGQAIRFFVRILGGSSETEGFRVKEVA